jgi:hypothetical protein
VYKLEKRPTKTRSSEIDEISNVYLLSSGEKVITKKNEIKERKEMNFNHLLPGLLTLSFDKAGMKASEAELARVLPKKNTIENAKNKVSDACDPPKVVKNNSGRIKLESLPRSCDNVDTKLVRKIKGSLIIKFNDLD